MKKWFYSACAVFIIVSLGYFSPMLLSNRVGAKLFSWILTKKTKTPIYIQNVRLSWKEGQTLENVSIESKTCVHIQNIYWTEPLYRLLIPKGKRLFNDTFDVYMDKISLHGDDSQSFDLFITKDHTKLGLITSIDPREITISWNHENSDEGFFQVYFHDIPQKLVHFFYPNLLLDNLSEKTLWNVCCTIENYKNPLKKIHLEAVHPHVKIEGNGNITEHQTIFFHSLCLNFYEFPLGGNASLLKIDEGKVSLYTNPVNYRTFDPAQVPFSGVIDHVKIAFDPDFFASAIQIVHATPSRIAAYATISGGTIENKNGQFVLLPTQLLLAERFPLQVSGTTDFSTQEIVYHFEAPAQTVREFFHIKNPENITLPFKIDGTIQQPILHKSKAMRHLIRLFLYEELQDLTSTEHDKKK